jgi:hypothetical protein
MESLCVFVPLVKKKEAVSIGNAKGECLGKRDYPR